MFWYSLEAPRRGASNEYPQHMFSWRNKKKIASNEYPQHVYVEKKEKCQYLFSIFSRPMKTLLQKGGKKAYCSIKIVKFVQCFNDDV